jgi:UDP-N-acetylmuramate--alanine ligase
MYEPESIYFLGIGGIGMSALARYFNKKGYLVSGYDRTETALTQSLVGEGIPVHYVEDINSIPKNINLVVYTPAIPADNKEFLYLMQSSVPMKKRSVVLGEIASAADFSIAIAGTHGKTTVTGWVSHIFNTAGIPVNAFVGGIVKNFNSNILLNPEADVFIGEADEYDRSFLQLTPDIVVVTSMDADHLDIYHDKNALENTFLEFMGRVKKTGVLITKKNLVNELLKDKNHYQYSAVERADFYAENVRIEHSRYCFTLCLQHIKTEVSIALPGMHNVENAVVAAAVCFIKGIPVEVIKLGLESYQGICRRFDYQINDKKVIYIDDYAHHPEELNAFISAVRQLYPGKKISGIFQPHLFSRTQHFAGEFSKALDLLDEAILLPIYPARELPIDGVTSSLIFDKMETMDKKLFSESDVMKYLEHAEVDVLMTMGAGDIDKLVEPIQQLLIRRFHE